MLNFNKPSWVDELMYNNLLDGKSIFEIEKFIQKKELNSNFDNWYHIWCSYTGIALPALPRYLYDKAQTLDHFFKLQNMMGLESELAELTQKSIERLQDKKNKLIRTPNPEEKFRKDNFIEMLENLQIEVEQTLIGLEHSNNPLQKLHGPLGHFFQYISMQHSEILKAGVGLRKVDSYVVKQVTHLLSVHHDRVMKERGLDLNAHKQFLEALNDAIKEALNFEYKRLSLMLRVAEQASQINSLTLDLKYKIDAYQQGLNKSKKQKVDDKKINKLNKEIENYQHKYQKALKTNQESKMEVILSVIAQIQKQIDDEKNKGNESSNPLVLQKLKEDCDNSKQILAKYEPISNLINRFGLHSSKHDISLDLWLGIDIYTLEAIEHLMVQATVILNGGETSSEDFNNLIYNSKRENFLQHIRYCLKSLEQSLSLYKFNHDNFATLMVSCNIITPKPNPIDNKASGVCVMLKDFTNSYLIMHQQKQPLDDMVNIVKRLQAVLNRCQDYLDVAQRIPKFTLLPLTGQYSECFDASNVKVDSLEPMLQQVDESIVEDQLYPYLVDTLDRLERDELLPVDEVAQLKADLDHNQLKQFEQIIDFDIDEFKNSVENSIRTVRRFKTQGNDLPPDYYINLISSFGFEIKKIEGDKTPNVHKLYRYLDEADKLDLVTLIQRLFSLNNSYAGIHYKLALSISSTQQNYFQLKQDMFAWSLKIAHQYFYGRYTENASISKRYATEFLIDFDTYLNDILSKLENYNICLDLVNTFYKALSWHVMNFSNYGGITIFNGLNFEYVSERGMLIHRRDVRSVASLGWSKDVAHVHMLVGEFETSFFLNHIDLRLKPLVPKLSSTAEYVKRISELSTDLLEMRRLLVKNFKAEESIIELDLELTASERMVLKSKNGKMYALWQWETLGDGLGRICLHHDTDYIHKQAIKASRMDAQYTRVLRVNRDGCLSPIHAPWLDAKELDLVGVNSAMDFNLYILEKFHELFFNRYTEIAQKVKKRLNQATADNENNVIYDTYDLEVIQIQGSLQHLASEDSETVGSVDGKPAEEKYYFNKSLKSSTFFKILKDKFDVVITQGKGSEINVSRLAHGGRVRRLKHHGKIVEYNAGLIRSVLKRLNIPLQEWVQACN